MADTKKMVSISLILMGVVFLALAIGMIYGLLKIGGFLENLRTMTETMSTAGSISMDIPTFSTYFTVGWIFSILILITGLVTLVSGVALLVEKSS